MKRSLVLVSILGVINVLMDSSSKAASLDLTQIEDYRTQTVWTCQKGDPEALVIFKVNAQGQSIMSDTDRVIMVRDAQICNELEVGCPFVAPLYRGDAVGQISDRTYRYLGATGRSQSAIAFYADSGGMKVSQVRNGSRPEVIFSRSWYFNPGECFIYQAD